MKGKRRNSITARDSSLVIAVAIASGVIAAFAGCNPTGEHVSDALVTAAFAAFVTWATASAPWWAMTAAAGGAAVFASAQPMLLAVAMAALAIGAFFGLYRNSLPPVRAASGALTVQVVLRLEWNPMFLGSAVVAIAAAGLLAGTGIARRPGYVRRRTHRGAAIAGGFVLLALVGMGLSGGLARSDADAGYQQLLTGLKAARNGDPVTAAATLHKAAATLRSASGQWSGPFSQPARLVPVLAQNGTALGNIIEATGTAAEAAADALDLVDLDQLRVVGGVIDVEAMALLAGPIGELEEAVAELAYALDATDSPWLLGGVQSRIADAGELAEEVARTAQTTRSAAEVGPAMLGNDGPRRYLLAFTSPAEARGQSGLMGNWAEITVTDGALRLTDNGRTNELISDLDDAMLDAPADYLARYGPFGAGGDGSPVHPKYWSNVTMSPNMPSVGSAMAQLYEAATGRSVDGVIVVDPAGLAALLDLTGPVTVTDARVTLSADNVEQYLLLDQYSSPEAQREDVLEAVTLATVDRVLVASLPGPQVLAADLGPAATEGHISMWAARPDEQRLMQLVGLDAALPPLAGSDGLAVVNDNASGNKIDSFLRRSVTYLPVFDRRTGRTTATLTIQLTNDAPATGFPDYVIGNLLGLPSGTNRTLLSVFTPLSFTGVTLDGAPIAMTAGEEQGWRVFSTLLTLAPGEQRVIEITLEGVLAAGDYRLVYRPQPLANPEQLYTEARSPGGATLAGFSGTLERRSVLSGDGLASWR
jgi:hypothetical protein